MITLIPIEQSDFENFLEHEIVEYAQDKVKSGNWMAEEDLSVYSKKNLNNWLMISCSPTCLALI